MDDEPRRSEPRTGSFSTVTLSVLDRLIDREPANSREAGFSHSETVRVLKAAVRRDLEWLLNTRRVAEMPDEGLEEVNKSVYVFGLPDFSNMSVSSAKDRTRLLRNLKDIIQQFEPRLADVNVIPLDADTASRFTLRFRIEALLLMDPVPEQVLFDTVLDLSTAEYKVKGEPNAG